MRCPENLIGKFKSRYLPEDDLHSALSELLANLWARGAALQCCFNQESIDQLVVVYHGAVEVGERFDPTLLSACLVQCKFRKATSGCNVRPIGIPRDGMEPLPYLWMLIELGTEVKHKTTQSAIEAVAGSPSGEVYSSLVSKWTQSVNELAEYEKGLKRGQKRGKDEMGDLKRQEVKTRREAMDGFERYSISVRGTSAYKVLQAANITQEFETLLRVTIPQSDLGGDLLQQMWPLRRLGHLSGHTAWMIKYGWA